jgi:hypothetical protein
MGAIMNVTLFAIAGALLFLGLGLPMIITRKRWAAAIARRREWSYPQGIRRVFSFQESPIYFLVVGIIFSLIGLFFVLGTIGSLIR